MAHASESADRQACYSCRTLWHVRLYGCSSLGQLEEIGGFGVDTYVRYNNFAVLLFFFGNKTSICKGVFTPGKCIRAFLVGPIGCRFEPFSDKKTNDWDFKKGGGQILHKALKSWRMEYGGVVWGELRMEATNHYRETNRESEKTKQRNNKKTSCIKKIQIRRGKNKTKNQNEQKHIQSIAHGHCIFFHRLVLHNNIICLTMQRLIPLFSKIFTGLSANIIYKDLSVQRGQDTGI